MVGLRPLNLGNRMALPGESVPGAEHWVRLETWIRTRKVRARSQ